MISLRPLVLGALATVMACGTADRAPPERTSPNAVAASTDSALTVVLTPAGLSLANRDTVPLYFTVFDASLLPVIEWAPCIDPATCEHVAPGAKRTVAMPRDVSDTVVVFWWRLLAGGGTGHYPDRVRSLAVPAH